MAETSIIDTFNNSSVSTRIVDQFFQFEVVVNASEFDIVFSYFKSVSTNLTAAKTFTVFLFRISNLTQIPVLTLLDEIKGKTKLEINTFIAYYLNSFKSKTTLYGLSAQPRPNQTVQRNVVV